MLQDRPERALSETSRHSVIGARMPRRAARRAATAPGPWMFYRLTTLSRQTKQLILLFLDVLLVPASLLASMAVAAGQIPDAVAIRSEWPALTLLTVSAAFLSIALGLPRVQLKSYEISALGRSAVLGSVLAGMLGVLMILGQSDVEGGTPVILALIYTVFSAASRLVLLRILLSIYRHHVAETRVLIYGAGKTGVQLAMALKASDDVRLMGFLDDNTVLHGMTVAGQTVYPARRIEALIDAHQIQKVLLAMPSTSHPRQAQIARQVARLGVEVQTLPSFAQLIGQQEIVDKLAPVLPAAVLGRAAHLQDALDGGCTAYQGRCVMITGAGGSIGSELCRQILNCKPAKLVLLELTEFALFSIERDLRALAEDSTTEIAGVLGSVTDARLVGATIRDYGVQVILHAAAYKHVSLVEQNPLAGIANNVFGTQAVAQAAAEAGIERFVLVSSDKAVATGRGWIGRQPSAWPNFWSAISPAARRTRSSPWSGSAMCWARRARWCRSSTNRSAAVARSP